MDDETYKIKTKIKKVIDAKGLSIYRVAELADVTDTCIRNWYNKRNYKPTLESVIKICKALNISLSEAFLDNEESLYPLTKDKRELIDLWLLLTKEQQQSILALLKSIINNEK